jgi:hypothetical protein
MYVVGVSVNAKRPSKQCRSSRAYHRFTDSSCQYQIRTGLQTLPQAVPLDTILDMPKCMTLGHISIISIDNDGS